MCNTPKYTSLAHSLFWYGYFLRNDRHRRSSENGGKFTHVRKMYIYKGTLHFLGCFSVCTRNGRMIKSVETLILVYCAFPDTSHNWLSLHPKHLSCLAGDGIPGDGWGHYREVLFPWVFPMHIRGMHVTKLLFVFLLLICLLLQKVLSQGPRRVEQKVLFLPYTTES